MSRNFLIVVDVQKIFTQRNIHDIQNQRTLRNIQTLSDLEFFDKVIVTRFINHEKSPLNRILNWSRAEYGSETDLDFNPPPDYVPIIKDGYGFNAKDLEKRLEAVLEDRFYIVGYNTETCVYSVALNLFDNNMYPIILKDACYSSGGKFQHSMGLYQLERNLGKHNIADTLDIHQIESILV